MAKEIAGQLRSRRDPCLAQGGVACHPHGLTRRICDLAGDQVLIQIPLRRLGEPEDVARAVCFLGSDEASYITGEILRVTAGLGL